MPSQNGNDDDDDFKDSVATSAISETPEPQRKMTSALRLLSRETGSRETRETRETGSTES
jgi:hypothetical protein